MPASNFPRVHHALTLTKHSTKCLLGPVWSPKDLVPWGEALTRGLSHLRGSGAGKATSSSQHLSQHLCKEGWGSPVMPHWQGKRVGHTERVVGHCPTSPLLAHLPSGKAQVGSPRLVGKSWISPPLHFLNLENSYSSFKTPSNRAALFGVKIIPSCLHLSHSILF